jgi:hypothetical protein
VSTQRIHATTLWTLAAVLTLAACSKGPDESPSGGTYVLGSVVIDTEGNRTTFVQTIASLDSGPFDNKTAVEVPGNGVILVSGSHFYAGLAEEPTWVRYSLNASGGIEETGRMSLLNVGVSRIDYGNAIVDEDTAVSVFSDPPVAVVWNPSTMTIKGQVELNQLIRDGYALEVWTTVAHEGRVYIPGRWSDWEGARILPGVSLTLLDPETLQVVGTAEDDRCASGGRVVFDDAGYAYVMGDGRNYSIQMFAHASGGTAPDNCLLRIAPGGTDFEENYFYTIPSLTGGKQSIGELETSAQGSGLGFAKMFYPEKLPEGMEPVDFDFWEERAHKMWRIRLAQPPIAEEVQGVPFSTIGFGGSTFDGRLYSGESPDGSTSEVYEIDPNTNTAVLRFKMDGYFNGLYQLKK